MKYDILVVDDNDLVRSTLQVVLKINSLSYITAENGKKALDLLKDNEVSFVISDIDMPEMNGVELAKCIRASYPAITIVAFTGSSGDLLKGEAMKYFHRIYPKSESMMELVSQIKAIIVAQYGMVAAGV